jgi:cytochrome c oxidase subunit IV
MAHSHAHSDGHPTEGHLVPVSSFAKVLGALLFLTVVTVLAAQVDMGKWNIVGALLIASVKASLVIAVFMHGLYENKIVWTYIVIPFILLAIMIGGVFTDNPFRIDPHAAGSAAQAAPAAHGNAHAGHH